MPPADIIYTRQPSGAVISLLVELQIEGLSWCDCHDFELCRVKIEVGRDTVDAEGRLSDRPTLSLARQAVAK